MENETTNPADEPQDANIREHQEDELLRSRTDRELEEADEIDTAGTGGENE